MSNKDGIPTNSEQESVLDLEQAQELTVAEAARKNADHNKYTASTDTI